MSRQLFACGMEAPNCCATGGSEQKNRGANDDSHALIDGGRKSSELARSVEPLAGDPAEDLYRLGNVFDPLLAHWFEAQRELVFDMVDNRPGNGDASWLGQLLEPCRNIDAVAVAVFFLDDHIAEIDADPQIDALAGNEPIIPFGHAALKADRALHGIDNAAEFRQQAVAHQLENAAVMPRDLWLEQFLAVGAQPFKGVRLVLLH
jgi:hypothetical protein